MAYLYEHKRLDTGEVFYVGIGLKDDPKHKRAYTKCHRNNMWYKIVEKAGYEVSIIFTGLSIEEIKKHEVDRIKMYGRKNLDTGTLCNMTDGGDGCVGMVVTDEMKEKISAKNKGKKRSPEFCQLMKELNSGENHPNYGKKGPMSNAWGRKVSEETRIKLSLAKKGKPLGSLTSNSRPVINLETGIFYESASEGLKYSGLNYSISHFTKMMTGRKTNKTSFVYI